VQTAIGSTFFTPNSMPYCYLPATMGGASCLSNPVGEVAVSMDAGLFWTTGGGFSVYTQQATYQSDVVQAYLAKNASYSPSGILPPPLPPADVFNAKGRAYPDAVAVGTCD
jgi:hypothetical protein